MLEEGGYAIELLPQLGGLLARAARLVARLLQPPHSYRTLAPLDIDLSPKLFFERYRRSSRSQRLVALLFERAGVSTIALEAVDEVLQPLAVGLRLFQLRVRCLRRRSRRL